MKTNIREYEEHYEVEIESYDGGYKELNEHVPELEGRLSIVAYNEGRHNNTRVDLLDVIDWVRQNAPGLLTRDLPVSSNDPYPKWVKGVIDNMDTESHKKSDAEFTDKVNKINVE